MSLRRLGILAAAWCAWAGMAFAEPTLDPTFLGGQAPSAGLLRSGLLNFSRLEVSHSLGFAAQSGSAGATSGGLWVTRLGYRLADPLHVAVDFGAALNTSGDGAFLNEQSLFLKGFKLDYRPSRHLQLNISYQNLPAAASPAFGHSALGSRTRSWGSPLGIQQ